MTGNCRVGVFGALQPREVSGNTIAHHVNTTEIYCMLDGAGTLVTGGTVTDQNDSGTRGAAIAGGVTRRIVPGDGDHPWVYAALVERTGK